LTLSKFGLDPKAEVILLRDCWAFIKPYNYEAGSSPWVENDLSWSILLYSTAYKFASI
jgi:hypothetical protein